MDLKVAMILEPLV